MELETINKLYLELSQFTTATSSREARVERELRKANDSIAALERERDEAHRAGMLRAAEIASSFWHQRGTDRDRTARGIAASIKREAAKGKP